MLKDDLPPEIDLLASIFGTGDEFIGSDCQFQKKSNPFSVPRFDQGAGYDIPAFEIFMDDLDKLSGLSTDTFERRAMTVLYGTNTTFDLTRDNTDARCNNYIDVTYPPPAPVTTQARCDPSSASTAATAFAFSSVATPTSCRLIRPGWASGPRVLNTVGIPSSALTGPANRIAG